MEEPHAAAPPNWAIVDRDVLNKPAILPSDVTPPTSLADLVSRLHEVFQSDDVSVECVQALMTSYRSNPREWKTFAKFDPHRYTRNLVDAGNGKFNLMVLCWNEAQGSSIHSHANAHCFMKVLSGQVKEELYEWPRENPCQGQGRTKDSTEQDEDSESSGMQRWAENGYEKDSVAYINDSIGLHRVENPSHTDKAVTLHLYSPPFEECDCFDQRTGRSTKSRVTFWSKYGRRTPFGRNPEGHQTCAEDN